MGFGDFFNPKIKKMNWYDIAMVKLSVMGFTLAWAKLWPPLLSLEWYWYAVLFVLFAIVPFYKVFKK